MKTGRLFVISGPSGAGKGSICALIKGKPNVDISVSMTTRRPREGEIEGKSYYFVSKEDFEAAINQGKMLEYAEVFGEYYGTPLAHVQEKLEEGRDVILEIDVQGAMKVKEAYPDCVMIFIKPPSMRELEKRIAGRGTESKQAAELRLDEAKREMEQMVHYDYSVVNDDLDIAVADVLAIMRSERLRKEKI